MSRLIFDKFLSADYEGIKQGRLKFYNWTQPWKLGGKIAPTWKDIILHGNTALTLVNAKADSLNYLKLFGGTEQLPETYIDSVTLSGGCEQRNLPAGYTQVESLANTSGAYIATSISLDDNDEIEFWWNAETSGSIFAFSQGASADNKAFQLANTSDNGVVFDIQNYNPYRVTTNVQAYNNGIKHIVIKNREIFIDGVSYGTSQGSVTNPTNTLRLFISSAGVTSLSKFTNRFTVKNKINLIPARRNSDSVLGMYDTVSGNFLTNAGTGTFTAGADVTPTPDNPMDIVSNNGTIKYSANIANVNAQTALVGYYITTGGVVTADIYNWIYQDFIPVKPNTTYTLTMSSSVYFVSISEYSTADDSGFVIRKVGSTGSNTNLTITTGATTNYVRFGTNINKTAVTLDKVLAIDWMLNVGDTMAYQPYVEGGIYTDGTVETVTDSNGLTATAQMLLSVGDYNDTQEVLTGAVTRNVGIKVLDGTETFTVSSSGAMIISIPDVAIGATNNPINTHFGLETSATSISLGKQRFGANADKINSTNYYIKPLTTMTASNFKQWLADQYNAGHPVVIVYPLATATTESVTGQFLSKSPVTQTAGSISNLPITITESEKTVPTPTQPLPINCNNGVLKVSPNLFNKNSYAEINAYVNSNTGVLTQGSPGENTQYCVVIPCLPNTTYTISGRSNSAWGAFTSSAIGTTATSFNKTGNGSITTGANDKYLIGLVRANQDTIDYRNTLQVEQGSTPTPYMPYGIYVDGTTETVEVFGNNLIDLSAVTDGYYYNPQGTYTSLSASRLTDYIPIEIGKNVKVYFKSLYSISNLNVRINLFNSSKVWQSQEVLQLAPLADGTMTITPTYNGYIRVSGNYSGSAIVDWNTASITKSLGTATAEMLLKVGDYQDVQSVLDGVVTRNVGIKVLDGTESWTKGTLSLNYYYGGNTNLDSNAENELICNQFSVGARNTPAIGRICVRASRNGFLITPNDQTLDTVEKFKQFLADQYNSGNPVIVVYPLATPTTETVTAQPLTIQAGTNVVEITQASMDNLELEVSYKAGVEVTVTEIENAQLDNSVEVTVNG